MKHSTQESIVPVSHHSGGGYCRLQRYRVVAVSGRDAVAFLNRQLTCNLDDVTLNHIGFGAWCTPKGRIVTLMYVVQRAEGLYLLMPEDLLEFTLQRLRIFVMRDDVVFTPAVDEPLLALGLIGKEALDYVGKISGLPVPVENYHCVQHNELSIIRWPAGDCQRLLVLGSRVALDRGFVDLEKRLAERSYNTWQLQNIRAAIPDVTQATREVFLPQMLNLERLGGVSFIKGCYPGQEIVARTQHLGRIKRRMYLGFLERCSILPCAGANLQTAAGENVARIVSSADNGQGGCEFLAVLPLAKAELPLYMESTTPAQKIPVTLTIPVYGFGLES